MAEESFSRENLWHAQRLAEIRPSHTSREKMVKVVATLFECQGEWNIACLREYIRYLNCEHTLSPYLKSPFISDREIDIKNKLCGRWPQGDD